MKIHVLLTVKLRCHC